MDLLAPVRAFDRLQRRTPVLGIPVAVLRKFSDDGAGNASALIAYWGFFSIFPLLLLFVTILGFVLDGDPSRQQSITDSVIKQFPVVGISPEKITGSSAGLTVGVAGTLLSALGVTTAVQNAFNLVYAVPHRRQPDFFVARFRGLQVVIVVGLLQVASSVVSGAVTNGLGGLWLTIAGYVLSLGLNLVLFLTAFRLLTSPAIPTSELLPGIALATVGWALLQALGGLYVAHVVKGSEVTYGTFATVIGLLVWLYLGARIVVYSAEINVVLTRGLWPRSIMDPPLPADRRARASLAKMEERDDRQSVDVTFHPPIRDNAHDPDHPDYAVAPHPDPGEHARSADEPDVDEARGSGT
jgi:YihY family inner membrane protein